MERPFVPAARFPRPGWHGGIVKQNEVSSHCRRSAGAQTYPIAVSPPSRPASAAAVATSTTPALASAPTPTAPAAAAAAGRGRLAAVGAAPARPNALWVAAGDARQHAHTQAAPGHLLVRPAGAGRRGHEESGVGHRRGESQLARGGPCSGSQQKPACLALLQVDMRPSSALPCALWPVAGVPVL